jgi:hypothetical protein
MPVMPRIKNSKNYHERKSIPGRERIRELRSVIDGQEIERQRLSRELHDGIGQSLIAIKLKLESLSYLPERGIKEQLTSIKTQVDLIIDEIRQITTNLMPAVLDEFGLVIAVRNLCDDIRQHAGIRIDFEFKGEAETLNRTLKTYIYRIVQEAIHNIVKHSAASEAYLKLIRDDDYITLLIHDNGKGFLPAGPDVNNGHGLQNMQERVKLMHGKMEIQSGIGKGTRIEIKIPVF